MARGNGVRRDIPYKDRLLLDKYKKIEDHRNDAARVALKILFEILNDLEGLGYAKLSRIGARFRDAVAEYYQDPELYEARLNRRLEQIGFRCEGTHVFAAVDGEGVPVKVNHRDVAELREKAKDD
jgi:hypothetical protein